MTKHVLLSFPCGSILFQSIFLYIPCSCTDTQSTHLTPSLLCAVWTDNFPTFRRPYISRTFFSIFFSALFGLLFLPDALMGSLCLPCVFAFSHIRSNFSISPFLRFLRFFPIFRIRHQVVSRRSNHRESNPQPLVNFLRTLPLYHTMLRKLVPTSQQPPKNVVLQYRPGELAC